MQYLTITENDTLASISKITGRQNADLVLRENDLNRTPNIGKQYFTKYEKYVERHEEDEVDPGRKEELLNGLTDNEDVFEKACLMDDDEWKFFSAFQSFKDAIKIPESVVLPSSSRIIGSSSGNGIVQIGNDVSTTSSNGVSRTIYSQVMEAIRTNNGNIPSTIFDKVNTMGSVSLSSSRGTQVTQAKVPQYAYNIPWGKVQLYSSVLDEIIDIPVYPEEVETERSANYTSMPNIIYQYEPWVIYESSGPREQSVEFHLHRDLWSGDHRDGKANELIRFCEANTFPKYTGSSVVAPIVKLYVSGKVFISGVLQKTGVSWSGPLGLDNWYLEFKLRLSIQEVSDVALNIQSVRKMGLIGV